MNNYPLASPSWDKAEIKAMEKVIASGMFSMGENVAAFEEQFAQSQGAKYCVMVNSGSSANLLMVAALFYTKASPLKRGDEVIVPAVSWSTTYNPLYQYGLKLKFVDIDAETLNYDLSSLAEAVSEKTKLVVAVNILGNPNDFKKIKEIIGDRDIILIEDNCESLGAKYHGKLTGTFGLLGSYSFYFSHHICTMEGGMLATDDEELYHILLSLRSHGWTRHLPKENKVTGVKSDDPFVESFRFVLPGYNVRPLEINGVIGLEQLKKIDKFIEVRRANVLKFRKLMDKFNYFYLQKEIGESSWFGFSLVLKEDAPFSRQDLIKSLTNKNIEFRPIVAGNFVRNDVIRFFDYSIHGSLINADYIDRNGIFIGNHHFPMDEELALLEEVLISLS